MNRFLSWPGAKFRQMSQITDALSGRPGPWQVIIEPFFGTGAFTWEMMSADTVSVFASEKDARLRTWWQNLLLHTDEMISEMSSVRREFEAAGVDRAVFDRLRDTYNVEQVERPADIRTSAMLWVLVYQSTNNLARFNRSGGYNQTWGKGRRVPDPTVVFDDEARWAMRSLVRKASPPSSGTILIGDFRSTFEKFRVLVDGSVLLSGIARSEMIAFLDPPYVIRTETYQKGCWTLRDEEDMWTWVRWMDVEGIPWVMTNYLSKDDSVSGKVVEHPMMEEIRDTWRVLPLDRRIDTRPAGVSTPSEEIMILGKSLI